jgi:hypothetical protein
LHFKTKELGWDSKVTYQHQLSEPLGPKLPLAILFYKSSKFTSLEECARSDGGRVSSLQLAPIHLKFPAFPFPAEDLL